MKIVHRNDSNARQHYVLEKSYAFKFNPELLYAGSLSEQIGWHDEIHSHDFLEMMLVLGGVGSVLVDGVEKAIQTGDLILYNANVFHQEKSSFEDPLKLHFLALSKFQITNLPESHLFPADYDFVYHTGDMFVLFKTYFKAIVDEASKKEKFYFEVTHSLTKILLMYFFRMLNAMKHDNEIIKGNESMNTILNYIDSNYLSNLLLSDIADKCFVNKFYLSHMFTKYQGISVGQYILLKRLDKAKSLLTTTNLTVSLIAEKSGFNDFGYFCRAFKKANLLTPLQYRRTNTNLL